MKERVEGEKLEVFGMTRQYVKDLVTNMNNSPNYIKIKAIEFMKKMIQIL